MLVSGLPTVVIASVIVHKTNADHSYYNWDITRCRKSECKIGIDSISRGVEAHCRIASLGKVSRKDR